MRPRLGLLELGGNAEEQVFPSVGADELDADR
jgi:hypothetical protein